ncbi:MAG: hypothetical protein H7141_12455 [Burkholderiales bacterium]|nr:hypothetical protein [Bacteroidia bacterium]
MKKSNLFIVFLLLLISIVKSQNVGISSSGAIPNASAMLDIVSTDKGLLVPRFALSDITVAAPVTSPTVSLIVYNTFTSALAATSNNVLPGFYYWDGAKWVAFAGSGSREWALLGNAGTTAGTNFLGTTDNVDLQFRVNNIQGGKINIGSNQTFFGYQAGLATTGTSNSFFGTNAGIINSSGLSNTGIGYNTLSNSNSSYNTGVGVTSLRNLTSGGSNTFMGVSSGFYFTSGSGNTGLGMYAAEGGNGAGIGSYNTAIGYAAGSGFSGTPNNLPITSGSYNSFLGYGAALNSGAFNNASAIGAYALAGASDVMVLGSINGTNGATADTKVGIGITTPLYPLHVVTSAFAYAGRFENLGGSNQAAVIGRNTAASGAGTGYGVYGYTGQSAGFAVRAQNINTSGTGILATGENAINLYLPAGSGGAFTGVLTGLVSSVNNSVGTGISASGQGLNTFPSLVGGSGGAFSGTTIGLYGIANNVAVSTAGGYFTNGNGSFAYVGYTTAGGVAQKINGPGAVSTIVKNTKNESVNLYCPESPEILFQDFGAGSLVNGFAHITLDENISKNIKVNGKHPLRVIIQLEGDCKGAFVSNKSQTGFDVNELQGGNSNISFTWFISANRADAYNEDGTLFSKFEDVRFGEAPGQLKQVVNESAKIKSDIEENK